MNEWMDGWMDGWTHEWMNGWMAVQLDLVLVSTTLIFQHQKKHSFPIKDVSQDLSYKKPQKRLYLKTKTQHYLIRDMIAPYKVM